MATKKVFGIVLAGGEGKRLMPLTADRAKPAVPFGGNFRLVDFALSNLVNSGLQRIVVLTQYKSHSLDRHVSQTWRMEGLLGSYVASVPAQQRLGKRWFAGSADAILQSLNLMRDERPDIVVVVGADHVYRMDFSQMVEAHIASGRSATVAAIRQPIELADQFGVIKVDDADPTRIEAFLEKPKDATGLPDSPNEVLASMGNYVFDADALVDAVLRDGQVETSDHDMGGDIIPDFVARGDAGVYDLQRNEVPGSNDRDKYYWRDVGTIDSFFDAHMDLIAPVPVFNLYNQDWPIFNQQTNLPPAKFVRDANGNTGATVDSIVSLGCLLSGAQVERSVIGPWATIDSQAKVLDSIVFERATIGAGAIVNRAILDKDVVLVRPPSHGSTSRYRGRVPRFLVVLDADSTLLEDEVIELLADAAGTRLRVQAVTERAMRGEIDFAESLRERVATLAGLPTEVFARAQRVVRVTRGADELVRGVHAAGGTVGVVSGGFNEVLDPFADALGLDHCRANRLEVRDGVLTGRVLGDVVDAAAKAVALREWATADGVDPAHTVAVGDGANDLAMMGVAALAVAFDAKPLVRAQADVAVVDRDLSVVLAALGLRG